MTSRFRLGLASALLVGVLLLTWAGASQAKTRAAWLTPQAMAKKIHGYIPQIPTDNTSAPSFIAAANCHGLGKARRAGLGKKYSTFRCTATWQRGKSRVWARALPRGKFCASSTGLNACPRPHRSPATRGSAATRPRRRRPTRTTAPCRRPRLPSSAR